MAMQDWIERTRDRPDAQVEWRDRRVHALEKRLFDLEMTLIRVVWFVACALILACGLLVAAQL
jgi:hypothetical protein